MRASRTLIVLLLSACAPVTLGGGPAHFDEDRGDESLSVEGLTDTFDAEDGWHVSPVSAAFTDGVSRVSAFVERDHGEELLIEARAVYGDGSVGEWTRLGVSWEEGAMQVGYADVGPADGAQIRFPSAGLSRISVMRWSATTPVETDAEVSDEAGSGEQVIGARTEGLIAALAPLGVVSRSAWGARATRCSGRDRTARYRMAIHHTSSPSTGDIARRVRGFQAYHMDSRGWCDVGYHFLIGRDGTIYEGRPLELRGAHVGGNNSGNIGISFVGCFEPRNCSPSSRWGASSPSDAMVESASRLVAALADHYGITRSATSIRGHREHSGASTDCPGINVLDRMSEIRSGSTGAPSPTPSPTPAGGACAHSLGGTYADRGCSSGYQCCGGSWRTRRTGCGACSCVEESGRTGCAPAPEPPAPEPPAPEPSAGASCAHSLGGTYGDRACSAGYQCCDGAWRARASGCGACACVEESGAAGCTASAPPPPPEPTPAAPAGASCIHSLGGAYANTACSAGYQCCDGAWRTRSAGCGGCFCVEESGTAGCGGASGPPMGSGLNAGLTLRGSEIPRAGLSNGTLRGALGVSVEPHGEVVTVDGASWVRGAVSHFGGPSDTGVSSTETGAVSGERLRDLNNPERPSASTLRARPEDYYYVAMRWNYSPNGTRFWRDDARLLIRNPVTGAQVVVRPVDWGPHTRTGRIIDLSPQAVRDLGVSTDDNVDVAFAAAGTPLGVVAP